jgi:hypothetical protein
MGDRVNSAGFLDPPFWLHYTSFPSQFFFFEKCKIGIYKKFTNNIISVKDAKVLQ